MTTSTTQARRRTPQKAIPLARPDDAEILKLARAFRGNPSYSPTFIATLVVAGLAGTIPVALFGLNLFTFIGAIGGAVITGIVLTKIT